jgi:uncharacterized membrane protein YhhN
MLTTVGNVMRSRLFPFAPFLAVSILHLASLWVHDAAWSTNTKPLLIGTLIVGVLWTLRVPRGEVAFLLLVALAFSLAGDVLIATPGDVGFLLGLGGFFLAHVTYLLLFLRRMRLRPIPLAALGYLPWWVLLLVLLWPYLGALLVPVAVYGLVLGASASAALACNRWIAVGAGLFLASDTILAVKLFHPGFALAQDDVIIMTLYLAGQFLMVWGVLDRASRPA